MQIKSNFILTLSDAAATIEQVGGKGTSLSNLAAADLPVPPGFYITTAAYRRFVADHGLQKQILATVAITNPSQPATLEEASSRIVQLFREHPMADDMAEEIRRAYAELGEGDVPVAVRSSATAEDLPETSFAGQQESYLNIHGIDEVLDAIKNCWASLWTARAIAYRIQNKIDQNTLALAVVVQKLVFADAAGIMFTANPINGKRNEAIINAAWGLGEAVVGGAVTPDAVTVSKLKGKVIHRETNEKQLMTVRKDQGTHEQVVPDSLKKKPVLSDAQAIKLTRYGIKIEELYGTPMDFEWTL